MTACFEYCYYRSDAAVGVNKKVLALWFFIVLKMLSEALPNNVPEVITQGRGRFSVRALATLSSS